MGGVIGSFLRWITGGGETKVGILPQDMGPEADTPDPSSPLTPREAAYIRHTWAPVKADLRGYGIKFFLLFFKTHPDLQQKFAPFAGRRLEDLVDNKRLAAHGATVMTALDSYISNLDDVSVVVEMLKTTAHNHIHRGIVKEDFEKLYPLLIQFLSDSLGSEFTEDAKKAWNHLLAVVHSVIASAFED